MTTYKATPIVFFFALLAPALLSQQGQLTSWGYDAYGQVSDTPPGMTFVQVSSGVLHSLALSSDGSIFAWGADFDQQVSDAPQGTGFILVEAGGYHSHALRADGSIASWGYDGYGVVSSTPLSTDFVQIAGGVYHSLALKSDGSIVSWGRDDYSQVSSTPIGNDFVMIGGGGFHSLAMKSDGSIVSWGRDTQGQVSTTPSGAGFIQISGGVSHSLALMDNGRVISWGDDTNAQVTDTPGDSFVLISGGGWHSTALKSDGSIVSWGSDSDGQVSNGPTDSGFVLVSGGGHHSAAVSGEDSDLDGLINAEEDTNNNGLVDSGESDPFDQDTDDDGLGDGEEANIARADSRWLQGPSGNFYRAAVGDTWSNSSAAARSQGYELTSVQDSVEAQWLEATFGGTPDGFWIGLTDFSGTLEWSDGNPVTYTQWATGEPNTTFMAAFVGGSAEAEPGNWYADFAGLTSRLAVWEAPGPDAPMTALDPLNWDTDGDGLGDGQEDGVDSIFWDGHGIPGVSGTDPGVFVPDADPLTTTDPLDMDSDEDGLGDGVEDSDGDGAIGVGETAPGGADTDGDSLLDGLELGLTTGTLDTDGNVFIPDADPASTTDPLAADTDLGGVPDGVEDQNRDGGVDSWETDPNLAADEALAFYVSNLSPGLQVHFEVYNATPLTGIFPAYSITGGGPTPTTLGIDVALSLPIVVLDPFLSDIDGRASIDSARVPASVPPGVPVWIQAIEVPISAILPPRASNPLLVPIGAN